MGFLDCLQMYAESTPQPQQAIMKRMYIQEKAIPEILPNVPPEEILRRIDEINAAEIPHFLVTKYMKPYMETQKMLDIIKKGKFTNINDLR